MPRCIFRMMFKDSSVPFFRNPEGPVEVAHYQFCNEAPQFPLRCYVAPDPIIIHMSRGRPNSLLSYIN